MFPRMLAVYWTLSEDCAKPLSKHMRSYQGTLMKWLLLVLSVAVIFVVREFQRCMRCVLVLLNSTQIFC